MNRLLIGLAALLSMSACDRHAALLAERAELELKLQQGQEELKALDAQFAALGADFATAVIVSKRQSADLLQKNAQLEAGLAQTSEKCSKAEKRLLELLPQLDSYKARLAH